MKTQRTFLLKLFALSLTGCLGAALAPVSTAWADPPLRTVRASVSSTGAQGNGNSYNAVLSANGRYVVFSSDASNLVAGDNNGVADIFVHDLKTRTTKRVSVSSAGIEGNGSSRPNNHLISANGRYVVFLSDASNLVAGDDNEFSDIFVRDLQTSVTRRVFLDDRFPGDFTPEGTTLIRLLSPAALSDNGRFLAFEEGWDGGAGYVIDLKTGVIQFGGASGPGAWAIPTLSGDGRFFAYTTADYNRCPGHRSDGGEIWLRDLKTGVERCLLSSSPYNYYGTITLSADGRYLSYISGSYDGGEPEFDVFVLNVNTLEKQLVSVNRAGAAASAINALDDIADLSAHGRFVAFESRAGDLVASDNNGAYDIFVRDLKNGITRRVSINSARRQGNESSSRPSLSADGRLVAFSSAANNLVNGDTNSKTDIFVRLWR